jgi:hypothetical protein
MHSNTATAHSNTAAAHPNTACTPSVAEAEACPFCGAELKERPLFTGSFFGCLC